MSSDYLVPSSLLLGNTIQLATTFRVWDTDSMEIIKTFDASKCFSFVFGGGAGVLRAGQVAGGGLEVSGALGTNAAGPPPARP